MGETEMHVTLICGKLCAGKTTLAHKLRKELHAVLLSCDEITLALTGLDCGAAFDEIAARTQDYLYDKAAEIVSDGIPVILDWGFWTKESRRRAREFFAQRGIPYTFLYLDIYLILTTNDALTFSLFDTKKEHIQCRICSLIINLF